MKKSILSLCLLVAALSSCKKDKNEPSVPTTQINYTCYSEKGNFTFKYIDKNSVWHDTTIVSHTLNLTIDQVQANYSNVTSMKSTQADSLYIKASSDWKKVDKGFRSNGGSVTVSVQLSDMK